MEREALAGGITGATLVRASLELGVNKQKVGYSTGSSWVWTLPEAAEAEALLPSTLPSKIVNVSKDDHPEKVSIFSEVGHLWQDTGRCLATGGAHEYAQMRDAQGHPVCVACGEAAELAGFRCRHG